MSGLCCGGLGLCSVCFCGIGSFFGGSSTLGSVSLDSLLGGISLLLGCILGLLCDGSSSFGLYGTSFLSILFLVLGSLLFGNGGLFDSLGTCLSAILSLSISLIGISFSLLLVITRLLLVFLLCLGCVFCGLLSCLSLSLCLLLFSLVISLLLDGFDGLIQVGDAGIDSSNSLLRGSLLGDSLWLGGVLFGGINHGLLLILILLILLLFLLGFDLLLNLFLLSLSLLLLIIFLCFRRCFRSASDRGSLCFSSL